MDKYQQAAYLVNLHTLLEAQEATAINKSSVLLQEYNEAWAEFKADIQEAQEAKKTKPT